MAEKATNMSSAGVDDPMTFKYLDPYEISSIKLSTKELGRGSYAIVYKVEYMKVKCAGKKIHEILINLENSDVTLLDKKCNHVVERFEKECKILSMIHHPNIVQFLGVYFEEGAKMHIPMLIMEYLPMNLTTCIKKYGIPPESTQATNEHGILPMEISYSILYDVALDLHYLHKQTPPIIHRDLPTMSSLSTC